MTQSCKGTMTKQQMGTTLTKGLFTWRKISATKILEGGTTLPWVYKQNFRSVSCPSREGSRRNLKMVGDNNKNATWALLLSLRL